MDIEQLYAEHYDQIKWYCRTVLGSNEYCDDAAQQTFTQANQKFEDLRMSNELSSWTRSLDIDVYCNMTLHEKRIIKDHIKQLRKGADIRNWWGWLKNTAFARSTDILRREGSIKDLERAYSVKIAEERSRSEDLKHSKKIAGYIKFMGDPYKKALHHVYIKGTSQKEAAKDMGITYEYFRVVLQRGRDKLREMIDTLRIQGDRDG